jgi:hypothetical protein
MSGCIKQLPCILCGDEVRFLILRGEYELKAPKKKAEKYFTYKSRRKPI